MSELFSTAPRLERMSEISWIALFSTVSASSAPSEVATDNPDTATPACPVIWKVASFASKVVADIVLDQSDLVTSLSKLNRDWTQIIDCRRIAALSV